MDAPTLHTSVRWNQKVNKTSAETDIWMNVMKAFAMRIKNLSFFATYSNPGDVQRGGGHRWHRGLAGWAESKARCQLPSFTKYIKQCFELQSFSCSSDFGLTKQSEVCRHLREFWPWLLWSLISKVCPNFYVIEVPFQVTLNILYQLLQNTFEKKWLRSFCV